MSKFETSYNFYFSLYISLQSSKFINEMSLNSILFSIKKSISSRGTTIDDVVLDYDRRRSGIISLNQFDHILTLFGVSFQPQEYRMVTDAFSVPGNCINLARFADAIKSSREETPQRENSTKHFQDLKRRLSARQVSLRDLLRPYDRLNRGIINQHDFIRAVGSFPSSQAIVDIFAIDGFLNLNEILRIYSDVEMPRDTEKVRPPIVENVIRQLIQRNIDIYYYIQSNDKCNNGKLTVPLFQMAISTSGIRLSPSDLRDFVDYYADDGMVNYINFFNDMDKIIASDKSLSSSSQMGMSSNQSYNSINHYNNDVDGTFRYERPNNYSNNTSNFSNNSRNNYNSRTNPITGMNVPDHIDTAPPRYQQAEAPNLDNIINNIKGICKSRKIQLSDLFPPRTASMNKFQFSLILKQAGLQLTITELDFLSNHFENRDGFVDVQKFLNMVEIPVVTHHFNHEDAEAIIQKVRNFLQQKQLTLAPRLVKFDREGSGEFNVSLINQVLKQLGMYLTEFELEALQEKFPGRVIPNICWNDFTQAVDPQIMTQQGQFSCKFESPTKSPIPPEYDLSPSPPPLPSKIPPNIFPILQQILQFVKRGNIELSDEFRALDRIRAGFIQPTAFISFMSQTFPRLNRQQIDSLLSNYGKYEFHYPAFLRDLGQVESEILNDNRFNSPPTSPSQSSNYNYQYNASQINSPFEPHIPNNYNYNNYNSNNGPPKNSGEYSSSMNSNTHAQSFTQILNDKDNEIYQTFLRRIKAFCVQRMITPIELFRENDRARIGYVLNSRLESCFRMYQFSFTPQEIKTIISIFHDPEHPERFLYNPLVREIEQLKIVQEDVKMVLNPRERQEEINAAVRQILNAIREKLVGRRRRITMYFSGISRNFIPANDFVRRLSDMDLIFSKQDIEFLLSKYQQGNGVDWGKFCNDVEHSHFL
ncbi:hypothetical protein TRFO_23590 [Tritrichomonas foetus]|uniref:EF hand family protein n=1 Tax=Tritrichomonas foetus TaxID=1144522 RepID=A0A1J4KEB1_9EUKA|nr:hypothetical protein TRFO_23590 [Tritrichomonas foetus]|eukprot:OHT08052.1 hypothetical protein TRFO_23590 [Tritrichomonas foetus]